MTGSFGLSTQSTQKHYKQTTSMENSSSSHHYGCCTSQKIPRLLENLRGDDNYKTMQIKVGTQYSLNQYSNRAVCVLCWRLPM